MKGSLGVRFMKLFRDNLDVVSKTEMFSGLDGISLAIVIGDKYFSTVKTHEEFGAAADELATIVINYYFTHTQEYMDLIDSKFHKFKRRK